MTGVSAYYNEIDEKAAAWLRELIRQGHIAPGDVDTRSIEDVSPDDLRPYTQCHFFAGIGVWSHSLRLAGWPDDRPVWTGSCPCQPFSAAGKSGGFADERHLWPAMLHLIRERRPDIWLGEQVASKDGLTWLDLVCDDLEGEGYAVGAVDTSSALTGAPHIRQRLRIGAKRLDDATGDGRIERRAEPGGRGIASGCGLGWVGDDDDEGLEGQRGRHPATVRRVGEAGPTAEAGEPCGLADDDRFGCVAAPRPEFHDTEHHVEPRGGLGGWPGAADNLWRDADWLYCRDGKWRPVEPGTFPLAYGAPARVVRLRGYGNAVDAVATKNFIEAFGEALDETFYGRDRVGLTPAIEGG